MGKPLEIENQLYYEKFTKIWQRITTAIKIEYLLLACVPKNPICPEHEFSLFLMPISPSKQGQNEKIKTLSITKLFEVKEWKCPYFWDSVIFWCWKSSLKKLNFRALGINGFWTKKHGTKFFWSFLMRSNPCFIRFEIKNHWLPLMQL